jgi:hypothetical protein
VTNVHGTTPGGQFDGIDTTTPSVARMYDYFLGGKDNFPADREAAERVILAAPIVPRMAKENRKFLQRVVADLSRRGIRQFVDIGSGLPTAVNTHEVAQKIAPSTRVVYVDNDPHVLTHGRAFLARDDSTTVITADLRTPQTIVDHPELRELIDWSRPVAVLLVAILHFIRDSDDPYGIVATLRSAMAPGSYLAISHIDKTPELEAAAKEYDHASSPAIPRSAEQVARFFDGLTLVGPGLCPVSRWRPLTETGKVTVPLWGGLGCTPEPEASDA